MRRSQWSLEGCWQNSKCVFFFVSFIAATGICDNIKSLRQSVIAAVTSFFFFVKAANGIVPFSLLLPLHLTSLPTTTPFSTCTSAIIISFFSPSPPTASDIHSLPVFQPAKWGFTARCWIPCSAVNVHPTVWPGTLERLYAAVKKDITRLTLILPIWPAHVRLKFLCLHTFGTDWHLICSHLETHWGKKH